MSLEMTGNVVIGNRPIQPSAGEFPLGVHHVENDDRVLPYLDENDVREFAHDQLAGTGNPVAFTDPFRLGREGLDFADDPPLNGRSGSRTCFQVVVSEDFLDVAQRLVGPENPHR